MTISTRIAPTTAVTTATAVSPGMNDTATIAVTMKKTTAINTTTNNEKITRDSRRQHQWYI